VLTESVSFKLLQQCCMDPGCQVTMVTKCGMAAHDVCGSSVWHLHHFTLLVPRFVRQLKFSKLSAPPFCSITVLLISMTVLYVLCRMLLGCTLFVLTELTDNLDSS
jgi:hypothetical protein